MNLLIRHIAASLSNFDRLGWVKLELAKCPGAGLGKQESLLLRLLVR